MENINEVQFFSDNIQIQNRISRSSRITYNYLVDIFNGSSLIFEEPPLRRTKLLDLPESDIEEKVNLEEDNNKTTMPLYEQYFLILPNKEDYFTEDFVLEINKARLNIPKYSKKIKSLSKKIETNSYLLYKKEKIYISGGKEAFFNCSNYLNNLNNYLKNEKIYLKEIINLDELKMPFPEDLEDWNNDDFISRSMKNLKEKFKGKYYLKEFIFKKCEINDGEISAILSILNEENIIDGNIFLNKEIKYIGINIKKQIKVHI